jgi:integrase
VQWHKLICDEVSLYSANKAMMILKSALALALAAEDHEFRPPAMPTGLPRRSKAKKAVLDPTQVARVIAAAKADSERGIYVAFPFLAGTRPSEMLGLMWDAVDFDANAIHIRCIQLRDGSIAEVTKTEAGLRTVPMSALMREMLLEWRVRCPRRAGRLERVFPAPGNVRAWPLPRDNGGGPLQYNNYRTRYWAPAMRDLGRPAATPHSARHTWISTCKPRVLRWAWLPNSPATRTRT